MDTQAHELAKPGTDVVSGVATDARLESDPPAFEVSWIEWNSDFRHELRLNDRIIAVNGESLSRSFAPNKSIRASGNMVKAAIGSVSAPRRAMRSSCPSYGTASLCSREVDSAPTCFITTVTARQP